MGETNLSLHTCPLSLWMNVLGWSSCSLRLMGPPNLSLLPPVCLFVTSQSKVTPLQGQSTVSHAVRELGILVFADVCPNDLV